MTGFLTLLGILGLAMGIFLIMDNRRPQATLAWLLVLFFLPGIGLLIYLFFGRDRKAFSKQSKLLMQDLEGRVGPLLEPLLSQQDAEIAALETLSTSHRKLMHLVRHNSRSVLTRHNRVALLQNSSEFYPALVADMAAARHSIHLQYYIWRSDEVGMALADLLAEKVRQGVEVRLLYDPIGSQRSRLSHFWEMRKAGLRVAPTSSLWRLHTISYRNHRKITVIDGRIAYTGGMNIGREHIDGGDRFRLWRDTQIRIEGQAAAILQGIFMIDWYNATRENLFSPDYFPSEESCPPDNYLELPEAENDVPVQILPSGPDSRWAAIRQLYSLMIVSARHHVYIQSPYFILDTSMAEALRTAAMSGVDVRVMLGGRESGNPLPHWAGNTFAADIVAAGVRVYLYHKGYLHAKTISIDSRICSVGSANIDIRSFSINYELNAVIYDERLARRLEEDFLEDLRYCTEFDPEEYYRRNPVVRFRDSLTRLLSPLL